MSDYYLLHNIGPKLKEDRFNGNYTEPALLAKTNDKRLTFDGIYENVWLYRDLLRNKSQRPILFIMGDYVGKTNEFDKPMPLEKYCTWDQLFDLVLNYGCEFGWHTWSHRGLTTLSDELLRKEVTPPFPMKYFAYPYGVVDERVARFVQEAGFEKGFSVVQGNDFPFQINRTYLI